MDKCEAIAKTADEAIEKVLSDMNCTIDQVEIEIFEEAAKGLFGFLKSNQFRVVATKKDRYVNKEVKKTEKKETVEKESKKQVRAIVEIAPEILENRKIKAQEFLTEVLKNMNIAATVDAEINNGIISLNIKGENMGVVIGKRGQTLDALQYLLSLVINRNNDDYVRVILDTENYRKKRRESLIRLANKLANKAVKYNKDMNLEPMNPYERRIIHSSLQSNKNVGTRSDGKEPYRRVVIYPRKNVE